MKGAKPSIGYYYLARVLAETPNHFAITTNFDSLTEDTIFMYTDKKPLVISHELLAGYVDVMNERPTIVKVHRDLLLNPRNAVSDTGKMDGAFKDALRKVLANYKPVVIGYGGNDGSLMSVLEDVKDWQRAHDDLTKAIELHPYNGEAWFYLAKYYEAQGDETQRQSCLDKAKECRYIESA